MCLRMHKECTNRLMRKVRAFMVDHLVDSVAGSFNGSSPRGAKRMVGLLRVHQSTQNETVKKHKRSSTTGTPSACRQCTKPAISRRDSIWAPKRVGSPVSVGESYGLHHHTGHDEV